MSRNLLGNLDLYALGKSRVLCLSDPLGLWLKISLFADQECTITKGGDTRARSNGRVACCVCVRHADAYAWPRALHSRFAHGARLRARVSYPVA